MKPIYGGCHCGAMLVTLALTRDTSHYAPRSCDCSFCRKHGAAYASDPEGRLLIRICDEQHYQRYRQGSSSAEMLLCRQCGILIGAVYQEGARLYGTVNVNAMDPSMTWGAEVTASPQHLSAAEKITRWKELWFRDVRIGCQDSE